jgi:hypothetical protein
MPNAPGFAAFDNIRSTQEQLALIVGRPLMRGQGQVTENERQMIRTAIGELSLSSNAADYQFRLNKVGNMIEAMNISGTGHVARAAGQSDRPTRTELSEIVNPETGSFSGADLERLAKKYNVLPFDLQRYIVDLYGRVPTSPPRSILDRGSITGLPLLP